MKRKAPAKRARSASTRPSAGPTHPLFRVAVMLMNAKPAPDGSGVLVSGVTLDDVHRVGGRLHRVVMGEDTAAKALLEPVRPRGKPRQNFFPYYIAIQYYGLRLNGLAPAEAAKWVADNTGRPRATVERIARANRDWALDAFEQTYDTAPLRAHLAEKSKGGNKAR